MSSLYETIEAKVKVIAYLEGEVFKNVASN